MCTLHFGADAAISVKMETLVTIFGQLCHLPFWELERSNWIIHGIDGLAFSLDSIADFFTLIVTRHWSVMVLENVFKSQRGSVSKSIIRVFSSKSSTICTLTSRRQGKSMWRGNIKDVSFVNLFGAFEIFKLFMSELAVWSIKTICVLKIWCLFAEEMVYLYFFWIFMLNQT